MVGETTKLKEGEPLPAFSPWFDGRRLLLRGVRGETLGLQILGGNSGHIDWAGAPVEASCFQVRSLNVTEPSSAMYGLSRGVGRYPDVLIPAQTDCAYYDLKISAHAKAGVYRGVIEVSSENPDLKKKKSDPLLRSLVSVELNVAPVTIDLEDNPLVWVFYAPKELARVHHIVDVDSAAEVDWERKYDLLFRAHGAYLASDLSPARFSARRGALHNVRYWPVAIDTTSDQTILRDVGAFRTLFHGETAQPFAIPVDEPHSLEERTRVKQIGEAVERAGGGVLRAVTGKEDPIYDGAVDVYISPEIFPKFAADQHNDKLHFWTYNGHPPQAGSMILDTDGTALRTWGWIAYRYGVELWYAWEGAYFSDRYNKGGPTDVMTQPLTFDQRRTRGAQADWGNGDGVLIYPQTGDIPVSPFPSLRLKALRRGLTDRLLLQKLEHCAGPAIAQTIATRLIPRALGDAPDAKSSAKLAAGAWSTDEAVWESARRELIDLLAERCPEVEQDSGAAP